MSNEMHREPIFWTSTTPNYNERDRMRVSVVDGEQVVERVPQKGHQGDYDDRRPARGIRFFNVVRSDGHIAPLVLTNAAAHMDHTSPYGQHMTAKARFYGWFRPGACPCALLATGELGRNHIADKSIIGAQACQPGTYSEKEMCPHALAELAARRKRHEDRENAREANFRTKEDKILDGQRQQTEALTKAMETVIAAREPRKGKSE